jgi:hypothetical protein
MITTLVLLLSIITLSFVLALTIYTFHFNRWVVDELQKKLQLRPGEMLRTVELKFGKDVAVSRADTGEPMDAICVVEYSNVRGDSHGQD